MTHLDPATIAKRDDEARYDLYRRLHPPCPRCGAPTDEQTDEHGNGVVACSRCCFCCEADDFAAAQEIALRKRIERERQEREDAERDRYFGDGYEEVRL